MLSDVGTIIDLSDDEWDFVADLFDPDGRRGTPAQHPRRRMVEAMLYLARTGCQWRYLPERFPAWEAVWSQWRRWRANGVWAAAMGRLARTIRAEHPFAQLGRWRRLSRCYEGTAASARAWLEVAAMGYLFARLRVEPA